MRRTEVKLAVAMGTLGVVCWLLWLVSSPPEPMSDLDVSTAIPTHEAPPPPPRLAIPPTGTEANAPVFDAPFPPRRQVIPPPAPQPMAEATPTEMPADDDLGLDDLRNGGTPIDRELLRDGLQAIEEDVEDCLDQAFEDARWSSAIVRVFFQIDSEGLREAWIEDHAEMPDASLDCLTTAIYGLDWYGISDDPIEVSLDFDILGEEFEDE